MRLQIRYSTVNTHCIKSWDHLVSFFFHLVNKKWSEANAELMKEGMQLLSSVIEGTTYCQLSIFIILKFKDIME